MAYQLYYSAPLNRLLSGDEVRNSTGITPDPSATGNITQLNRAQVFPLTYTENPYNPDLYTVTVSYVTANYPSGALLADKTIGGAGDYADQTWTPTAKPLADAKVAAKAAVKEAANTAAGTGDGFYALMLIGAASKLAADRSTEAQAALDNITTILDDLVTDIQAIEAAADVAAIDAIVNP